MGFTPEITLLSTSNIQGTVIDVSNSKTIPSIITLDSGIQVVCYRPGHSSLFKVKDVVRIPNADFVEITTSSEKFNAYILSKYQWIDILNR